MSNNSNNNNISFSTNQTNSNGNNQSSRDTIPDLIQVVLLSLTMLFDLVYIILILTQPTVRTNKLNWFTINLCLVSTLLSAVMLTMCITRIENDSSNALPCRLHAFLINMPTCQLMYAHAVITISRYFTIVHASKHIFHSTIFLIGCLIVGWLIAILAAMPYLFIDSFACSVDNLFLSYYTLFATLFIPALIVLLFNIRIFVFVHQSSRRVHAEGTGGGVSHTRDISLLKTMIVTFLVFVTGWVPLFITQIFSGSFSLASIVDSIFQILPCVSMLCDVILLIYINQPIRRFLLQIIRKQQQPQKRVQIDNTLINRAKTHVNTKCKQ
ncbi:hypothetical protein I4U23_006222 [Adineta vaga]|nr:hypothetical protein I4U23_006222 [Adineta vaga]